MSCLLAQHLERVLDDRIEDADREALLVHLRTDCDRCDEALAAAGLDEESLLMLLSAAPAQSDPERLKAMWSEVDQRLPAEVIELSSRRLTQRPAFRILLAAAAVLLLGIFIFPRSDYTGVKGSAPITVSLSIQSSAKNGETVQLTYGLDRPSHLTLFQWQQGKEPMLLWQGASTATRSATFKTDRGHLAYRFEEEPGRHLFLLLAHDVALEESALRQSLDPGWLKNDQQNAKHELNDRTITARIVRVDVED